MLVRMELDPEKELEPGLLSQEPKCSPSQPAPDLFDPEPSWARLTPNWGLCLYFSVKEGYKVQSDVNITLEFRTTSENGVLLGISSAKVDAIGLEMVNGKVGA